MRTFSLRYTTRLNIVSDGDDRSVLLIQAYQKHHLGKDELVGRLSDTIGEMLAKLKDGGALMLYTTCFTDAISAIKVFEATLCKDDPDGSALSRIAIKFRLTAQPRGDINADERQAVESVNRATEAVEQLGSVPTVVDPLCSAVSAGTNVATQVQKFQVTWDVLLRRMEIFNKIVADIAQVFGCRFFSNPKSLNAT